MPSDQILHLTTLGGLSLRVTGEAGERTLAKGKPAALIAFLACAPGRRATRERLATLLWADGSSETARQNLRQTLWYIKRRLGDVLETTDDAIGLGLPLVSDRDEFIALADAGSRGRAIEQYAGAFIPGFAAPGAEEYEEWAGMERRRLSGVFVACAELEARSALAAGRFAEAVKLGRRARDELPMEQAGWRLCLESLLAARDTVGLTAELAQLETLIAREDLEPDASLRAVAQAARRFLKGDGAAPRSDDAELTSSFVPDLVGREAEFRHLIDSWDRTGRGRGSSILIAGAAGLGKSRLLADFEARLRAARSLVVNVRAHQGNRSVPSALVASLAERLVDLPGSMGVAPSSAAVLVALSPRLADTFPGAAADSSDGENALRRRVIALAELVSTVSEAKPVAILVDDLHWADAESIRILAGLRASLDDGRVLTVYASRLPRDVVEALGPMDICQLPPLDLAGVAEFIARLGLVPGEDWTARFIPAILAATHGIPFELIETLQRLSELRVLRLTDGAWTTDDPEGLLEEVGRGSAVRRRLAALSPAEHDVLVRLATLGRPTSSKGFGTSQLEALEHRGFTWREGAIVGLAHDEIADGALELATSAQRNAAHGWAAADLRARGDPALLGVAAMHADRAGDESQLRELAVAHLRTRRGDGDRRSANAILAEFLGPSVTVARRVAIANALPWDVRWPLRVPVLLAGVLVVLLLAAAIVAGGRGPAAYDDVDARVYLRIMSNPDSLVVFDLLVPQGSTRMAIESPRVIARADVQVLQDARIVRLTPLPDSQHWIGYGPFLGRDGDEIIEVDRRGVVRFPSPSTSGDGGAFPSPDGRFVAFSTARYDSTTMHMSLAILDRASGVTTRLTSTGDIDALAGWSPDGTRLAFTRNHFSGPRGHTPCVIGIDGSGERCDWPALVGDHQVMGWVDAETLILESLDDMTVRRLDLRSGAVDVVAENVRAMGIVPALPVVYGRRVEPVSGRMRVGLWRTDAAGSETSLDLPPPVLESLSHIVLVERPRQAVEYLARITIAPLTAPVPRDGSWLLSVDGHSSAGRPMAVRALRFTTRDSAVLTVDSAGLVRPRGAGSAWVIASAGGWRTDSVLVTVGEAETTTLLTEDWSVGIDRQWRPFGEPRPRLVQTTDGPVFDVNGDANYMSGAYSRERFDVRQGLGVEFRARFPINYPQWQSVTVHLHAIMRPDAIDRWDHRTGSVPTLGSDWFCQAGFPDGEGNRGRRFFSAAASALYTSPAAPPDLYAGGWHVVRIQAFPDGRCGIALDGVPVAMMNAGFAAAPAALFILGQSVGSSLVVGKLEVWRGVRHDIRWETDTIR